MRQTDEAEFVGFATLEPSDRFGDHGNGTIEYSGPDKRVVKLFLIATISTGQSVC